MFQISKKSQTETNQAPKDNQSVEEVTLKKLNLRTLKGAFMVLLMGYGLSIVAFAFEMRRVDCLVLGRFSKRVAQGVMGTVKWVSINLWNRIIRKLIKLVMFKYQWN